MSVKSFSELEQQLGNYRPNKKWYRRLVKRSAVAIILRDGEQGIEVLMIKRAQREGDPWSGHMGFPGGRAEAQDAHNLHTARRETLEEIGLDTEQHTRYMGRLSDINACAKQKLQAMVVTPYVLALESKSSAATELSLSHHEVEEVVWVPLDFLGDTANRQRMTYRRQKQLLDMPCYYFEERRIWGMSLMMLDELVKLLRQ